MTDKIPQTETELMSHLSEQLQFLMDSANRYDEGYESEAKRMAIALRILLYDHGNSKSLLGQLGGLKNIKFLDTAIENTSNVYTAHCALVRILFASKKTQYVALLDDTPSKMTDYDSWWNGVIFEDNEGNKISRREIILTMTDQDGGAHVDPCIRKDYSRLSKGQSLGHMYSDMSNDNGWVNMQGAELASVRQIAHEVLKSLNPNYEKKPALPDGIVIGSEIQIEVEENKNNIDRKSKGSLNKVGRNDLCPCGSGKKFKKCCGA